MRHTDHCGICGETYEGDNLMTCRECRRDFCYRCGDAGERRCWWCRERER